eukprot:scaffold17380_cov52-Cyclotella_meneghiniana.AAC.1
MSNNQFDSEGFDLTASENDGGVIYEIGGGVTEEAKEQPSSSPSNANNNNEDNNDSSSSPTFESERLKQIGNTHFTSGNHLEAIDYYTMAIEACPYGDDVGPTGEELLRLKEEFDERKREKNEERRRLEMERRRTSSSTNNNNNDDEKKDDENNNNNIKKTENNEKKTEEEFIPPRHIYGHKLAIYHANRAASHLHLGHLDEAIDDCTIAILYNPLYTKAYLRRSTAYERNDDTESALLDSQQASILEPKNTKISRNTTRLQKIENERMEKLKQETVDKLKDLGNSLLGNFGLSLDNFNAVQDPETGGYSISFNQNK